MEMNTTAAHATTITSVSAPWVGTSADRAYRIDCSVCGTVGTYATERVTREKARRHEEG